MIKIRFAETLKGLWNIWENLHKTSIISIKVVEIQFQFWLVSIKCWRLNLAQRTSFFHVYLKFTTLAEWTKNFGIICLNN